MRKVHGQKGLCTQLVLSGEGLELRLFYWGSLCAKEPFGKSRRATETCAVVTQSILLLEILDLKETAVYGTYSHSVCWGQGLGLLARYSIAPDHRSHFSELK